MWCYLYFIYFFFYFWFKNKQVWAEKIGTERKKIKNMLVRDPLYLGFHYKSICFIDLKVMNVLLSIFFLINSYIWMANSFNFPWTSSSFDFQKKRDCFPWASSWFQSLPNSCTVFPVTASMTGTSDESIWWWFFNCHK